MEQTDKTESFYRDTIDDLGSDDYLLEDPLAFWREEKKTLWKKILGRSETPFLIMGAGLILLVIIFFVVAPGGGDQDVVHRIDLLSERLQQVEETLSDLEALPGRATKLEERANSVDKSLLRSDSVDASATLRMNRIADELSILKKNVDMLNSKKNAVSKIPDTSAKSGKEQSGSQVVYHEVQPGETLYRISRQYDMSVDSLRRLNGLSEQAAIHPGQKLKVKASVN